MIDRLLMFLGGLVTAIGVLTPVPWYVTGFIVAVGMLTMGYAVYAVREQLDDLIYRSRPRDLIPVVEIPAMAKKRGWDFNGNLQILDLLRALNEAGPRGLLDFYARKAPVDVSVRLKREWPRIYVSPDEWKNLKLIGDVLVFKDPEDDNTNTRLYARDPHDRLEYVDVWVKRKGLSRWFRKYAREFRGQNDKEENKRKIP